MRAVRRLLVGIEAGGFKNSLVKSEHPNKIVKHEDLDLASQDWLSSRSLL
jgi:hypothetical protein